MIEKAQLAAELESLERQEKMLSAQSAEIRGAQRLCRHLIGKIERAEEEARRAGTSEQMPAEES